jgi:hypothetical protein
LFLFLVNLPTQNIMFIINYYVMPGQRETGKLAPRMVI